MKVILKKDVKGLGKKEDMVDVSPGHARNYLIPKKIAVEANEDNINIMKSRKKAEMHKKQKELEKARELAEKINSTTLILNAKSGDSGKLFGSITAKEICDKLKSEFGLNIDKRKLELDDTIKSLGTFNITVKLYPKVNSNLIVIVKKE